MATSQVHTPVKKMELLLECSICTETLTQPRTLSCFHSFCKHCLDKFVTTLCEKAVKEGAKLPEIFECPICRTEFHVKEGESVEQMPLNHFITNMVELLTLQQQAESIKCQSCKAQEPAASRCVSCEKYLCEKCLTFHNNWSAFEDHVVLTVEELSKPENRSKARGKPRCEKHNKVLKFYCETCKVLVCRYCMDLNHQRPEHLWFPLADVIAQHKEALQKSAAIFEQQMKKANESNMKIECAMESLKINAAKAKHAIAQQKQEILNELTMQVEKEMAVLLEQVDVRCNKASKPLMKQQADMNAYIAKTKSSLEFAKNIISSGSDEEIISIKYELGEKADCITKERPAFMEPVHNGAIDYQARTSSDILKNVELKAFGQIVSPALKRTREEVAYQVQSLCKRSKVLEGNTKLAQQLVEWVEDEKFDWQLCYRASINGWGAEDFHRKCDDVGPTVTVVKCGSNIFGGYTDQSWRCEIDPGYKVSRVSFLFLLQSKDKLVPYKCPINAFQMYKPNAIKCSSNSGAAFGDGCDLYISHNANENKFSYSKLGYTYQPPPGYFKGNSQTDALLAGSFTFTPTEIEVFCKSKLTER